MKKETLEQVKIFVIAGPRDEFNEEEFEVLDQFLNQGGSLLILLCNGPDQEFSANLNTFLDKYGLQINNGNQITIESHVVKRKELLGANRCRP